MTSSKTPRDAAGLVPTSDRGLEGVLKDQPESASCVHKFVMDVKAVRSEAMLSLYNMNVTQASLFPDLDGLARSMAYEAEFQWAMDVRTLKAYPGYEGQRHLADRKVSTFDAPLEPE